jgi:hypothetical protein
MEIMEFLKWTFLGTFWDGFLNSLGDVWVGDLLQISHLSFKKTTYKFTISSRLK